MELKEAINTYKDIFVLSDKQLDFLNKMCYIERGMWNGDVNELIISEAKRDLALTLRSYKNLKTEELEKQLIENGDDKWLIQTILQLTQ